MALVGVPCPSEEVEPLPETLEERLRREQLRPGGSELERKRQTIEALAELADRRRRRGVGTDGAGTFDEERHCFVAEEWCQVELVLSLDAEWLP